MTIFGVALIAVTLIGINAAVNEIWSHETGHIRPEVRQLTSEFWCKRGRWPTSQSELEGLIDPQDRSAFIQDFRENQVHISFVGSTNDPLIKVIVLAYPQKKTTAFTLTAKDLNCKAILSH